MSCVCSVVCDVFVSRGWTVWEGSWWNSWWDH